MTPYTKTKRVRFSRPFQILLLIVLGLLGGFLLHHSLLSLSLIRRWELLGGAVLFSSALALACYFLG